MSERPLQGRRIAITRSETQALGLMNRLRGLGAVPIVCPTIAFAPPLDFKALDAAIARLESYDWVILTSANAVRALVSRLTDRGLKVGALGRGWVAAIGPATAAELEKHGLTPDFLPTEFVAETLARQIGVASGQRVLVPSSDLAREALSDGLRARGAIVDDVVAYRTVPGEGVPRLAELLQSRALDAVTFASPSSLRNLLAGLAERGTGRSAALTLLGSVSVVCIGPVTARAARAEGVRVDAIADEQSEQGIVDAILVLFGGSKVTSRGE
ncbi:MAG TPA: uroporphyrinogen-III synthase [Chloroflexota bacterium]|nr:uroporphyrinogen-III synthase [Chloroflexota bacterium]